MVGEATVVVVLVGVFSQSWFIRALDKNVQIGKHVGWQALQAS